MAEIISNAPERVDITHRQGSTQAFRMTFSLPNGLPDDITGRVYVLNVRKSRQSNDVLEAFTSGSGAFTIFDGPNGILDVVLDDVGTPIPCGDWVYDMDEDDSGSLTPVMSGSFCVPSDL